MNRTKIRRSIIKSIKADPEKNKKWEDMSNFNRTSWVQQLIEDYEYRENYTQSLFDRAPIIKREWLLFTFAFLVGIFGGLIGNIIHDSFKEKWIYIPIVCFIFLLTIFLVFLQYKKERQEVVNEAFKDIDDRINMDKI